MTDAQIIRRNFTTVQNPRQRTKLQEALSEIPPARQQQEYTAAVAAERERRAELKSKVDELSTDELERLVTIALQRSEAIKERLDATAASIDEPGNTTPFALPDAEEPPPAS
jgi:vacuolar-type H+-ATPase subunit E/Vma4